jgi:hypothetical protein
MAKLLTRLKISEVSAVDRGAGEDCRILLRKRDQDAIAKAVEALETSVASIMTCDDDDETKKRALAESLAQFEYHLEHELGVIERLGKGIYERDQRARREKFAKIFAGKADDDGGDDVAKASRDHHDIGGKGLASATAELALDLIHHHRRRLGLENADTTKESTMDNLTSISKSHEDLMSFCKRAVEDGEPGGVSESALVEAATRHACTRFPNERSDVAFTKMWDAPTPEGLLLRKAARLCRDGAWGYTSAG